MPRHLSLPIAAAVCAVCLVVALKAQAPARGGRGPVALPEGEGKELVTASCQGCHQLNTVTGTVGYTQAGWQDVTSSMVALPEAQRATITQYLATHFPPKPGRAPKLMPGDATVTFKEWIAPTLGQRSRDPIQTPDGNIWWNGQFASVIGRLDPRTGEMREWKLDPTSRPHSITPDAQGNIWYTGNANGTIGKLNPATGDIQVFKMPDPAARDPHTAVFHPNGLLYFTLQQSGMLGRLNPATGEITLVRTATQRSLPYGIKVNSQGVVWISYNGAGKLASMDPATMELREYDLPDPATRSRRLALTSDDTVWFVNSSLGRIGRLNPKTGEVKEWPSPSGPQSHPYAIEVIDDIIWYNESNQRPDALVRFDPKTEKFQSWALPSGVGIIRHMRKTPDGNIAIHQSSTNRIGLAIISKPGAPAR
jgi:virginiamycin B lyase